jgi:PAS domain S-box-containing protein
MKAYPGSMFQFFLKIILPAFLAVILFVLTLFYIVIPVFEQAMMDRKREMIRELTNSATSILDKYHNDELDGLLTTEEAQQTAISRIQYLRYGDENKDYFWITDMHPTMIMHPYVPELNGTDLTDYEDSRGKKMFVEFVREVEDDGHGFVEYMWQWKDDSTHVVPKLSYVRKFEPWDWIIGTGIYIEDVRKEISALSSRLLMISIVIAAIVALILTFVSLQSFRIEKRRLSAEQNLKESREKYRSLVEASTEGLVMLSNNEIIFANSVFLDMAGMSQDDIFAMKWQDFFHLPSHIAEKLSVGDHNIETVPFETEISFSEDRKSEVLITITPILFYGRQAVIFSIKDISSDIIMKRQLHESRERFKTLMDRLNVGIFRTTMDSRGRFIEANDTALKLLGFEENTQLNDKYILDLFADKDDKRNFRNKLIGSGFVRNQVVKLLKNNGTVVHVLVSLAVITDENGVAAWCDGIIEPLTALNSGTGKTSARINVEELRALFLNMSIVKFIRPLQSISPGRTLAEAARLLNACEHRYLLVTDHEARILGYITDQQLAKGIASEIFDDKLEVYTVMQSPVPVVNSTESVFEARKRVNNQRDALLLVTGEQGKPVGVICPTELNQPEEMKVLSLLGDMSVAVSVESLKRIRKEFVALTASLVRNNIHSAVVLQLLSEAFDVVTKRLLELAYAEMGSPPVEFAMIVMGSEGRREQTLSTDQDHAFIIDDSAANDSDVSAWFLKLGQWISMSLSDVGYSLCKGDNMAMNPKWNQPLSVWKNYFSGWINTGQPKDLLDINIFFDFRLCHGKQYLVDSLQAHISDVSSSNPAYLHHLARNTVQGKLSVGDVHDIKSTVATIVNFARIYALQQGISEKHTLHRFDRLVETGVMKESSVAEGKKALEFLTGLRLQHQAELIVRDESPDNYIQVKSLTEFEQAVLKKAVSTISAMLSKLNFDFRLGI